MLIRAVFVHLALLCLVTVSKGDITISLVSGPDDYVVNQNEPVQGKWRVKITANVGNEPTVLAIEADDPDDVVEYIKTEVNNPAEASSARLEIIVRSKAGTSGRLVRVENVEWVSEDTVFPNGELWIQSIATRLTTLGADGNIGGAGTTPGGSIKAHRITETVHAAGHFTASVLMQEPIVFDSGSIDTISCDGNFYGSIFAENGSIERVDVGGDIGSGVGFPPVIVAINDIGNIACDTSHAFVRAGSIAHYDGRVRRFECRSGNFAGFIGLLNFTADVPGTGDPGLFVAGDMTGTLFTVYDFIEGEISISGALTSTLEFYGLETPITIGTAGLQGHIIVNKGNGNSEWNSTVTVGATELSPVPHYAQTALGGGAVGVVPFNLHGADCTPASCSIVATVPDNQIVLRHYGKVNWNSQFMPVKVEWSTVVNWNCPPGNTDWVDVTNQFTVAARDPNKPREVVVSPLDPTVHFATGTVYRLTPVTSGDATLRCEEVPGNPPPAVSSYIYYINVDD